jgi:hypothetical protein
MLNRLSEDGIEIKYTARATINNALTLAFSKTQTAEEAQLEQMEQQLFLMWKKMNADESAPWHPSCTVNIHCANHSLLADLVDTLDGILHRNL